MRFSSRKFVSKLTVLFVDYNFFGDKKSDWEGDCLAHHVGGQRFRGDIGSTFSLVINDGPENINCE